MVQPKLYLNDHGGAIRRRYSQDLIVGYRDDAKKQERKTGLVVSNHPGGRHAGVDLCERIQAASRTAFSSTALGASGTTSWPRRIALQQDQVDHGINPLLSRSGRAFVGSSLGVRVAWGPVFGWKRHVPEGRIGEQKLNPCLHRLVRKPVDVGDHALERILDRKSTRLNSSHGYISYAVFC